MIESLVTPVPTDRWERTRAGRRRAVGNGLAGDRVDGLDQEVVLVDVQAVGGDYALGRHAGPDDLRQPVDVQGPQSEQVLYPGAQLVGPGLGAEDASTQLQALAGPVAGLRQGLTESDGIG